MHVNLVISKSLMSAPGTKATIRLDFAWFNKRGWSLFLWLTIYNTEGYSISMVLLDQFYCWVEIRFIHGLISLLEKAGEHAD